MRNAVNEYQNVVVLGGTSDIGIAIARALTSASTRHLVLACRDIEAGEAAAHDLGLPTGVASIEPFDADAHDDHGPFIERLAQRHGDLDVVVIAFGVLGSQADFDADPAAAAAAVRTNYGGGVSTGLAAARQLERQGHGSLVVLSSVAGERVRAANFVYGSSKAGLDGFAQGLGDSLSGTGARVLVVRPGFVHSAMTEGMEPAPFATTPEAVAEAVVAGLRSGRRTVWVPAILRYVFSGLRHVPGPIWRRLPLG